MDISQLEQSPAASREVLNQIITAVKMVADELEANESAERLQQISSALSNLSCSVKVGVFGLTNSGKSCTMNALLGQNFLPMSAQRESVCPVCVQHDPEAPGTLFGRSKADDSLNPLALLGSESIRPSIKELNSEDYIRGDTQYAELVLRAPVLCLRGKALTNYEIYDTPGVSGEENSIASALAKYALEESDAIVLVISFDSAGFKTLTDFVEQIKRVHPNIMEQKNRMLVLINKYDLYFEGNDLATYSWDPETIKEIIARQIAVPTQQIHYFSAKLALKARLWKLDPSIASEYVYQMLYAYLCNTPVGKDIGSLKECTPENVLKLADICERFSRIHEVEDKLCETLFSSSLNILLKSSVDDSYGEINKLEHATHKKIENLKKEVDKMNSLIQQISDFIDCHCRKFISSSLDNLHQSYRENLKTNAEMLREKIIAESHRVALSISKQFETEEELKTCVVAVRNKVIDFSHAEIRNLWNNSIQRLKSKLQLQLNSLLSKLKQDVDNAYLNDHLSFECVVPDSLVERLSFPPAKEFVSSISDADVGAFILPCNISRQRSEIREKTYLGSHRYYFFGPRDETVVPHTVLVDYKATVYEINVENYRRVFETFASKCADFITNDLDTEKQKSMLSKIFLKELQKISKVSLTTLTKSLDSKQEQQQDYEKKIMFLVDKRQELHRTINPLLPQQHAKKVSTLPKSRPATMLSPSKSALYQFCTCLFESPVHVILISA